MERKDLNDLLGKTLTAIKVELDEIIFTRDDGQRLRMYHPQDCCEDVRVEEVIGDINDLIGSTLLMAEEVKSEDETPPGIPPKPLKNKGATFTWTFYKFATIKGYVTIRWYGTSNGYYSEEVDLVML